LLGGLRQAGDLLRKLGSILTTFNPPAQFQSESLLLKRGWRHRFTFSLLKTIAYNTHAEQENADQAYTTVPRFSPRSP
jgi:hypothetical protein